MSRRETLKSELDELDRTTRKLIGPDLRCPNDNEMMGEPTKRDTVGWYRECAKCHYICGFKIPISLKTPIRIISATEYKEAKIVLMIEDFDEDRASIIRVKKGTTIVFYEDSKPEIMLKKLKNFGKEKEPRP